VHVKEWPHSFVFTTEGGKTIWRGNFNKLVSWRRTVAGIGAPGLHFHDLRHTGNTLAAQTGASLRDLMTRMGHDSPRAALIYQHSTSDADRAVAAALDAVLRGVDDDATEVRLTVPTGMTTATTGPPECSPRRAEGTFGARRG
jgi:integrase